jgi:hypothetical protein
MSKTRTIEKLEDSEYFEYKGDVHVTGNIGKNVTVKITDGSLTVDGSIDDDSEVTLESKQQNNIIVSSGVFFSSSVVSVGGSSGKDINVKGNVGNNVSFNSHSSSYTVEGSVGNGSTFKTHNGEITTGIVGENVTFVSHNGDITSGNVGKNSSLATHNGDVHAGEMAANSKAISHNGDVRVGRSHASTTLKTHNGSVYENGVKRKNEKSQSSLVSISGMTFIGGGGRIIVNGQDITHLVNQTSSKKEVKDEPPVRYRKGF